MLLLGGQGPYCPVLCLAQWRCSAIWVNEVVSRGQDSGTGSGMGGSREGRNPAFYARRAVAPAFLLLSLWVVRASLLASPLNCPFVGLGLGMDARLALLM